MLARPRFSTSFIAPTRCLLLFFVALATRNSYTCSLAQIIRTTPTIGFNVEKVVHKNINFVLWDLGGQSNIRCVLILICAPGARMTFPLPLVGCSNVFRPRVNGMPVLFTLRSSGLIGDATIRAPIALFSWLIAPTWSGSALQKRSSFKC